MLIEEYYYSTAISLLHVYIYTHTHTDISLLVLRFSCYV